MEKKWFKVLDDYLKKSFVVQDIIMVVHSIGLINMHYILVTITFIIKFVPFITENGSKIKYGITEKS